MSTAGPFPPQGSGGGGNPTGYSESGGTVTLSNSVVIDGGAIETALAAATADGTLAISDPNGVADGALALRNAAGSANTFYAYSSSGNGSLVLYDSSGNYRTSLNASSGGGVAFGSDSAVTWSSNALAGDSVDTQIARASAGVVAISDPNGVADGALRLLDSNGTTTNFRAYSTSTSAYLDAAAGGTLNFQTGGTTRALIGASAFIPNTAGAIAIGQTANPFGSLTLGDATAQVALGHDGATDGLLRISDPNGVALGRVELMAADGTTVVGRMRAAGSNLVLESASGAVSINHAGSTVCFTEANVLRPNAAGAQSLGTASVYWSAVHSQEHRGTERSSNPAAPSEGQFVIWMSDGTGHGDDGDVLIASQAGGTTNYAVVFDHSAGTTF